MTTIMAVLVVVIVRTIVELRGVVRTGRRIIELIACLGNSSNDLAIQLWQLTTHATYPIA